MKMIMMKCLWLSILIADIVWEEAQDCSGTFFFLNLLHMENSE